MTETKEALAARVAAGAAWLDERVPSWWERVDPVRLNMDNPCGCVLGQIFDCHNFYTVVRERMESHEEADDLGFNARTASNEEYAALKELWTAEVLKRRGAA